jgi:hypothetical protein
LAVHLENGQHVFFNANNLHQVIENPRKTTLTAFLNCVHMMILQKHWSIMKFLLIIPGMIAKAG